MNKRKIIAVVAVVVLLLAATGYKLFLQRQADEVLTGTVEANKADIAPRIGGYLRVRTVKEGDKLQKGELAAQIDTRDLEAQLAESRAAYAKAQSQLVDLVKGARPQELREAEAKTMAAQSVYEQTHADRLRYEKLYADGAVARQQYDKALADDLVAANNLAAAREAEALLLAGSRVDEIEAQRAEVKRTEAAVETAEINLNDASLYSPVDGVVLSKNYEVGEYVAAGSAVLTVADLNDCWVRVYVPSDMLGSIKIGQECDVNIDAYPDRTFTGKITEISDSAEYTPRQSITKRERANLVFAVKVALPNEEGIFKPGMVADVSL